MSYIAYFIEKYIQVVVKEIMFQCEKYVVYKKVHGQCYNHVHKGHINSDSQKNESPQMDTVKPVISRKITEGERS